MQWSKTFASILLIGHFTANTDSYPYTNGSTNSTMSSPKLLALQQSTHILWNSLCATTTLCLPVVLFWDRNAISLLLCFGLHLGLLRLMKVTLGTISQLISQCFSLMSSSSSHRCLRWQRTRPTTTSTIPKTWATTPALSSFGTLFLAVTKHILNKSRRKNYRTLKKMTK